LVNTVSLSPDYCLLVADFYFFYEELDLSVELVFDLFDSEVIDGLTVGGSFVFLVV
jgi:hypothetical protein